MKKSDDDGDDPMGYYMRTTMRTMWFSWKFYAWEAFVIMCLVVNSFSLLCTVLISLLVGPLSFIIFASDGLRRHEESKNEKVD